MDTNALIFVFTATGIQLGFGWNYHRIYLKLFAEFRGEIEEIVEKRKDVFRENLVRLLSFMVRDFKELSEKDEGEIDAKEAFKSPDYLERAKILHASVVKAEEPLEIYNETREAARTVYKYLIISAIATFSGLIPAATGDAAYNILYFLFLLPLVFALLAWDDYYNSEKALVELRDKGE